MFVEHFQAQGLSPQAVAGKLTFWSGITSLFQNAGAFLGILAFTWITQFIGRKPAFAISFVLAAAATAATFWFLDAFWQIFVLIPIMGFCQLALFGGYAIYFPELFPTRLRSTGISFCYNVGRLVAAAGTAGTRPLDQQGLRRISRPDALPARRGRHVLGFPAGPARPSLRTRDQGQAAAGMNAGITSSESTPLSVFEAAPRAESPRRI